MFEPVDLMQIMLLGNLPYIYWVDLRHLIWGYIMLVALFVRIDAKRRLLRAGAA